MYTESTFSLSWTICVVCVNYNLRFLQLLELCLFLDWGKAFRWQPASTLHTRMMITAAPFNMDTHQQYGRVSSFSLLSDDLIEDFREQVKGEVEDY